MSDPQIICPNCGTEIKLTESLAAPLIAETRKQFERSSRPKGSRFRPSRGPPQANPGRPRQGARSHR